MKASRAVVIIPFCALLNCAQASIVEHYSVDFDTVQDGFDVQFGEPTIAASFDQLTDNALIFNPNISTYEQIGFDMRGTGFDQYQLSFDLVTDNLVNSLYGFTVLFDTPTVQTLRFSGEHGLYTYTSGAGSRSDTIGSWTDQNLMHVTIDVDMTQHMWTINTGIAPAYSGVFNGDALNTIRFSLSPWYGDTGIDPTISVGIDNILITSNQTISADVGVVPEPMTLLLLCSGFLVTGLFYSTKKPVFCVN
jgi:hypothetical protein